MNNFELALFDDDIVNNIITVMFIMHTQRQRILLFDCKLNALMEPKQLETEILKKVDEYALKN